MDKKYFVTTPIYYVNDVPHIGHAYTTLAADIIARYQRLILGEENVFYLTGTDEHGQKIAESAKKAGQTPKEFADSVSPAFKKAWDSLNIKPDFFIRTTDPNHEKVASELLQKIYDSGYIYEGEYEGLYCVGCEKFLTESDLIDGKCPLHPNAEPEYQKEKNYFLKLKELSKIVLSKIESDEYQILPEGRKKEIVSRLREGVEDISISRAGVSWGIPVPWDNTQTIYVWVEALMNYYSASQFVENKKEFWPADLHLLAKDILWFHSVIWQALLIAAGLPLPKTIFAHGFFTLNGQKISKSLGNTIAPKEFVERYGVDGARYLLISAVAFGNDGDVNLSELDKKYNADLANGLGNLVARVAKLCENENLNGQKISQDFYDDVVISFDNFRPDLALSNIWEKISVADQIISQEKPWEIEDKNDLKEKLERYVTNILVVAYNLKPFLPETSDKILKQFSAEKIKSDKPLFPRLK